MIMTSIDVDVQMVTTMELTMPVENKFQLIQLPYPTWGLEPAISRETIELHHGKHLKTYVDKLNQLLPGSQYEGKPLEQIVIEAEGAVLNNAGQILNHNLYFLQFNSPKINNVPQGELAEAINRHFGTFEKFKEEFTQRGVSLFGSGWVWLSADQDGHLVITQEQNAHNPVMRGLMPLMCFDVWEHAYYVDYRNRRAEHLDTLWQIINWDVISERFARLSHKAEK